VLAAGCVVRITPCSNAGIHAVYKTVSVCHWRGAGPPAAPNRLFLRASVSTTEAAKRLVNRLSSHQLVGTVAFLNDTIKPPYYGTPSTPLSTYHPRRVVRRWTPTHALPNHPRPGFPSFMNDAI
jgi:hypothetical protein